MVDNRTPNPPSEIPLGAMRFNSDIEVRVLEYVWLQVHTFSPNLAQSGEPAVGVRAIIHMEIHLNKNTINALNNCNTGGTAIDFGNSTVSARQQSSLASRIRALRGGGYSISRIWIRLILSQFHRQVMRQILVI